jgi:hypothetical protein
MPIRTALLAACLAAWTAMVPHGAAAAILYQTDFESFPAGPNHWTGNDGWTGNSTGTGSHGIDQNVIPGGGLGKTAFLGFTQPSVATVAVQRPIPYNPALTGVPKIEFRIPMGIQDSTNGRRDNFYIYFYNASGQPLAAIGFPNSSGQGITRFDGTSTVSTAASFLHGELHVLTGVIDLQANLWSAELDGVPMFQNASFNTNGRTRILGSLLFMWQIPSGFPPNHGNNWMLVAEVLVRSVPHGTLPFRLNGFSRHPTTGSCHLTWTGQPGFDYRVAWSENLQTWHHDLPGSLFAGITATNTLQFTDTPPPDARRRFYKVIRSESP